MRKWQTAIGTLLIVMRLCAVLAIAPLGVLLGSLGMDIHWNKSRTLLHAEVAGAVLVLCACFLGGVYLRRQGERLG